jgi:CelD/BcsL family acetyltransferase involved in cellulose biosynthesis
MYKPSGMNTENIIFTLTRLQSVSELRTRWRELEERADSSFFQTWDWIGCWIEEAQIAPFVLTGRKGSTIVALGVLQPSRQHRHLIVTTDALLLQHLGQKDKDAVTIEYNGFLLDRTVDQGALKACVAFLFNAESTPCIDELHLKGVPQNYQHQVQAVGIRKVVMARYPSWNVNLDRIRESGRGYLDILGTSTRYQIRRSIRLYEARGKLRAIRARDVQEALGFFDAMKNLHQIYWRRRGQPGSFSYSFFERFHRTLIGDCVPRGTVEMFQITAGDEPIGYLYNFVHRGRVLAYQSGFLYEKDPKLKPGLVSHYLCIERHLQEGAHVYDFMAGESQHKCVLGEPGSDMLDLVLQRPRLMLSVEEMLRTLKRGTTRYLQQRLNHSLPPSRTQRYQDRRSQAAHSDLPR